MIEFYIEYDKFVDSDVLNIKLSKEETLETHNGNYVFTWNNQEMPRALYETISDEAKINKHIPGSLLRVKQEDQGGYLVDDIKIRSFQINQTSKDIFQLTFIV